MFGAKLLATASNTRRTITEQITTTVNAEIAEPNDVFAARCGVVQEIETPRTQAG